MSSERAFVTTGEEFSEVCATMQGRLSEERASLDEEKAKLEAGCANFEAEKRAMAQAGLSAADILHLNVGGQIFSTKRRTLLLAPEGSILNGMFCGRWDSSLARDLEGRPFLDLTPELFAKVLSHLRTLGFSPPGAHLNPPNVTKEDRQEFDAMADYLGINELFKPKTAHEVQACDDRVQVLPSGSSVKLTRGVSGNGHAAVVGKSPLLDQESLWKVLVNTDGWFGVGVIANPSPRRDSYQDVTSYMWGGNGNGGQVSIKGTNTTQHNWKGWQAGDMAILRFDPGKGVLRMHHKRLGLTFKIDNIPLGPSYRIHLNMLLQGSNEGSQVELAELAPASADEAALVR